MNPVLTVTRLVLVVVVALGLIVLASCKQTICENTCHDAYDGWCDDGGEDSDYSLCECGSDCADCGTRYAVSSMSKGSNCEVF